MIATHPRLFRLLVFLLILLAMLCAWLFPLPLHAQTADPRLTAYLDSPGASTVTWTSDRTLCLSYEGAPDRCYAAGRVVVQFGHQGPLDGTLRPSIGGVYRLVDPISGASWHAHLRLRAVYLPVFRA